MNEHTPAAEAAIESEPGSHRIRLTGAWTTERLSGLEARLRTLAWPSVPVVSLDASGIVALDTGGA